MIHKVKPIIFAFPCFFNPLRNLLKLFKSPLLKQIKIKKNKIKTRIEQNLTAFKAYFDLQSKLTYAGNLPNLENLGTTHATNQQKE